MSAHCVSFLIYPGVASLDVSGPAQALAVAGKGRYEVTLLSSQVASLRAIVSAYRLRRRLPLMRRTSLTLFSCRAVWKRHLRRAILSSLPKSGVLRPGQNAWLASVPEHSSLRRRACWPAGESPPIGDIAISSLNAFPMSRWSGIRSGYKTTGSGRQPGSPLASTSPWPWLSETSVFESRWKSPANSWCFSSVPETNPSLATFSQVRWLARTAHSKPYSPGSPTTLAPISAPKPSRTRQA